MNGECMPKRRNEDLENIKYMKRAKAYLEFEKVACSDFEFLVQLRGESMTPEIKRVVDFFVNDIFLNYPKVLISLYETKAECEALFGCVNVSNIYDYTLYRFSEYYDVLCSEGVFEETETT